ncbi:MAG: DUF2380 domain-containing protein [Myxococcota bacterium]|nr:DUF2380 domain-containing protein [Myxococcota bacterium]
MTASVEAGDKPVYAVIQLTSPDSAVSAKGLARLTREMRSSLISKAGHCKVIGNRAMRKNKRRHRSSLAGCEVDCDVRLGRLIGADYVVSGTVQKSDAGLTAKLEMKSTQGGEILSSLVRDRADQDALEAAIGDAAVALVQPSVATAQQEEDIESPAVEPNHVDETSAVVAPEAFAPPPEKEPEPTAWDIEATKPSRFEDQSYGNWGSAVHVGYPLILERAKNLTTAFTPLFHIGVEVTYKPFRLFKVALAVDYDQFLGNDFQSSEFAIDDDQVFLSTRIDASVKQARILGVRPTFRLDVEVNQWEIAAGVGIGMQHYSSSGSWVKNAQDAIEGDSTNPLDPEMIDLKQKAFYSYSQSNWGFYAVFDSRIVYRFLNNRFGAGLVVAMSVPVMNVNSTSTSADVTDNDYVEGEDILEDDPLFDPDTGDYRNTVIRHLNSMSLLSFGLTVDARF